MTNKSRTRLEERLTDFTDRLLAGERPEPPDGSASDRELDALQETVRRARGAFRVEPPDPELRNRIRARLTAEWQRSAQPARAGRRGGPSVRRTNRALYLRYAALTAAIVLLVALLAPKVEGPLTGAASNPGGAALLIGAVLIVLVLALFLSRRKP